MPFWAAVRTIPQHEKLAVETVTLNGFEIFTPRTRELVGKRWRTVALFPGYMFARVVDRWRALERSPGVLSVIKFGQMPARVPDAEIALLIERADADGVIRLDRSRDLARKPLAVGAKVQIVDGPLKGFRGIYQGMTARDRERVLLEVLGGERRVELPRRSAVPAEFPLPHFVTGLRR
jgi:transcriptional antiterminator RfaH